MKEMIRALLVHLTMDFAYSKKWQSAPLSEHFDESVWKKTVADAADAGMNTIVLEVINGIEYKRHPEISRPDAYSQAWVREQVAFCREKGIALIPKLNFSATHDVWLGEYAR